MSESDGTPQGTGSEGLSENQAAERIASLLTPPGDSDGSETPKERKPKAEAPDPDEEPDADEADDDSEDGESEDDGDDADDEAEQPQVFTVKVDGADVEVTLDELQRGYSRTQDYTRKTMALAEAQKALEPEREALRQERDQYANLLPLLFERLQTQQQSPDLEQLRVDNPGEWAARVREMEQQEAAIRSEHERVTKEQTKEAAQERATKARAETEKLVAAIPDIIKPGAFEEVKGYALQVGFTPDQIEDEIDHLVWVTLHKAMAYDRLKAKAPQTKAKVEAVRTAKPGAAVSQPSKVTDVTRAKQRLAKTGRVEDAAAAIERMLG